MSSRWLVGLVWLAACGASARVAAPASPSMHVAEVRLEGNRAIADDELIPALGLSAAIHEGAALDPYLVTSDADRIRAAYVKRGFFAVRVASRIVGDAAVFTITEGPRAVVRVELTGLPPEVDAGAARQLAPADGAPFDYALYDAAKPPLAALIAEAGYPRVVVRGEAIASGDGAAVTLRYAVAPGARCTFGAVTIDGALEPSLRAAVIARLHFAPGERYARKPLATSEAELYELGRFATVRLIGDLGGAGPAIPITVALSEANHYEVHAGFGFGREPETYELRGRGGVTIVPAAHPLVTFAVDLRVAGTAPHSAVSFEHGLDSAQLEPRVRGVVSLSRLDLLRPRVRGEVEAGADYQTIEAFSWSAAHVRLGLSTPLGARWLQLRIGWLVEGLEYDPIDVLDTVRPDGRTESERLGLDHDEVIGAYQAAVVADLRDNPIEPHRGAYLDLRAAVGTPLALGDRGYLQLTPELRGYVSLGGVVVAARARVGAIYGDVPPTERYYSGGTSGQRGFSERQLSPTVPASCATATGDCVAVGGAGLIETGVELRRELGRLFGMPLGVNVFLDGGDVTDAPRALDPANLYWAAGTGVWGKVVGDLKVRIDVGYRLNRTAAPDPLATTGGWDNVRFHFGIGETY